MDWAHLWGNALQGVAMHPVTAYAGVFLVAFAESLALVGLLIPGTVIMFGIGAIVGSGALSLKITLGAAMAGAVAGDGLSYWLGRRYHQGLAAIWPFRRYPQLLIRGEAFFRKHGGKSVLLGRFVGPVRPVIPVVAGMLEMPAGRFVLVNVLSAVGWAGVYLLPGVVLGSSLALIGAVSGRLTVLALVLLLLIWLAFWLFRKGFQWLGKLGPKGERLLLPLLSLALFLAGWLFLGVLEDVATLDPLVRADQEIYLALQAIRTPWGDQLLVAVTELGDGVINLMVGATVLAILLWSGRLRAAGYWLLAVAGGLGWVQLFKWALHRPRPIDIYQGVSGWGFPSGHTAMSVVVYGFLAVLLVRCLTPRWRWLPFGAVFGLSLLIAFSRLYLGAHWFSDVVGGLALGWAWVTLLGIFYLRRPANDVPGAILLVGAALALFCSGGWHIGSRHAADLARYQERRAVQTLDTGAWLQGKWQELPDWRIDLAGELEQPFTLQWAGNPEHLAAQLAARGWVPAGGFSFRQCLNLFVPRVDIGRLPVLPQLGNGHQEQLLLVSDQAEGRMVLRLWPTAYRLADAGLPLYVGTVESERAFSVADLLTLPAGIGDYAAALDTLARDLSPRSRRAMVRRSERVAGLAIAWDGRVLLAGEPAAPRPQGPGTGRSAKPKDSSASAEGPAAVTTSNQEGD